MPSEELNNILFHAVPDGWEKQAYPRGWDFEIKSYKAICNMFKQMEVAEKFYKGRNLLKHQLGHIPTVPVIAGNEIEEKSPRLSTPRRAALECAGQKMQAIQAIGRQKEKYSCYTALGNIWKSAKYSRNTPPSMPHNGHTTKNKPAPAAMKNVVRLSNLTAKQKR